MDSWTAPAHKSIGFPGSHEGGGRRWSAHLQKAFGTQFLSKNRTEAMPRQSYDLPKLTSFATKVSCEDFQESSEKHTSSTRMEALETVVSSEPAIQFSVEAADELREWKDGLCDCCNDGKNCEFVLSETLI